VRILIFLDYFRPAHKAGGPIRIFDNLARYEHEGHSLAIVAQNVDLGDPRPLPVQEGKWTTFGHAQVLYVSPRNTGFLKIRRIVREFRPDVVHLNTFFSRIWTLKLLILNRFDLLAAPLFLSPHGDFAGPALTLDHWHRRAFVTLARTLNLFKGCIWIATAAQEVEEIRSTVGRNAVIRLASLPFPLPLASDRVRVLKSKGALRLIFLARLTAIKNLPFLLKVLPHVQGKVVFDIYGPIDPTYVETWNETFTALKRDCPSVSVHYQGAAPPDQAMDLLSAYDLFIQPSLSESFGYSIVEALSAGTPVLVSDRTPWANINDAKIGAALPLERPDLWIRTLQSFIDSDGDEWERWSARAKSWSLTNAEHGEALLAAYSGAWE
jgi:glycosyltransferase involved in cell wall biosynthesis